MGIKGKLVRAFMQDGNENVLHFALKLMGIDGGPGSGNFGHKGRPGEVGGSAPDGEGGYSKAVREIASKSRDYVDFWMNLPETEQKKFTSNEKLKEVFEQLKQSAPEETEGSEEPEWKPTNGTKADMPKSVKLPEKFPEIKVVNNPNDTATAHAGKPGEIEINLANFDPENIDSVVAHEAAHQLSNNDPELQQAIIMNYGNVLGRYNQKKHHFDGIYGEYNPEEAFATGFSNYLNYPKSMKEKYPDAYEFFDSLAKNQPEAVDYIKGTVQQAKNELNKSKRTDSKYFEQLDKRREIAIKWTPERQAEFLFRQGFLTEDQAVEAMENGTAADKINDYFNIMEYNGDPTPEKPIRKSPDLYTEISKGEHGGDWTQARKDYIQDWTGQSAEEAEKTYKQLETWFGGSWYSADTDTLDKYIDEDGAAGGEIFRGMHFTEDEYAAFMKSVQPGSRIGMNGHNSSWTSDRETAWGFSKNGDRHVIICCKKNKTSAPVSHLSSKGEDEILAHSRTQWTVLGVTEGSGRTEITVIEAAERTSEEERNRRKAGSDSMHDKDDGSSLENRMNGQNRFLKVTSPPEWLFKHAAEDGGPGSGNYGHKGRPGKVGGSGPGGGKQYRGGRADIGYYGSRNDWLNGLQGERQTKAVRAIAKHKRDLETAVKLKQRLKDLGEKGMLTQAEIEEKIKEAKLDKINPNMAPEEFALRRGNPTEQKQLLDLMKESRSWEDRKDRMIDENLDENEKKTLEFLSNEDFSKYTDAQKAKEASQVKNLLEAKAMGTFESEIDVPDEIQYGAGTKERPPEPEQEPEKPSGPDYSWYGNPEYGGAFGEHIDATKYMLASLGERSGDAANYTQEKFADANQRFIDRMAHGAPSNDQLKYGIRALYGMRDSMTKNTRTPYGVMRGDFEYTPEMYARLNDEEKKRLLQIVNATCNDQRFVQKIYDKIEDIPTRDFFSSELSMRMRGIRSNADKQRIKDYILLQEKMMLGAEPRSAEEIKAGVEAQKAQANKEREEKSKEWHRTHSESDIKKMYTPDSVSGASRGNPMTTDEADDLNANPGRASHKGRERGNCQTCTMAYELRRRGYNVIAKPRGGDAEDLQHKLSRCEESGWLDPDTGEDAPQIVPAIDKKLNKVTGAKWIDSMIKDGERYELSVCWNYCNGAHVLIAQKENGILSLVDPQSGKKRTGDEIIEFMGNVHLNSTSGGNWRPSLRRIDNALPKQEYYDKILSRL